MAYDWERAAARGDDIPSGLPQEQQLAFMALRSLYRLYTAGQVTREAAAAEKADVLRLCRQITDQRAAWDKATDARAAMWKALEGPATDFFETRDPEKADEALKIVYNLR